MTLEISDSSFDGNIAGVDGGAIDAGGDLHSGSYPSAVILTIERSTISNNEASSRGGGLFVGGSLFTIVSSTFSGNSAAQGGAVFAASSGELLNSTVTDNSSDNDSGALAGSRSQGLAVSPRLTSTIVADQREGPDCKSGVLTNGYNLDSDGTCFRFGLQASDITNGDANLAPLALNPPGTTKTHAVGPDSDAYNKIFSGQNGCGIGDFAADQRGVARPQDYFCEIGAYEFVCATPPCLPPSAVGGTAEIAVRPANSQRTPWFASAVALAAMLVGGIALGATRFRRR
jgi:predicted outer membrane repeat protein